MCYKIGVHDSDKWPRYQMVLASQTICATRLVFMIRINGPVSNGFSQPNSMCYKIGVHDSDKWPRYQMVLASQTICATRLVFMIRINGPTTKWF